MKTKDRPEWLDDALFYEIYPQSFMDSNNDGIGDIQGIIKKLDYIKDLGCNAIWLNPCFESPFYDAGYDVTDYYKVAKRYGSNEDLKQLFDQVHKRNMHIILDLVPGHTSVEHEWFKESMKAERNIYTDRYVWTDKVWEPISGYEAIRGYSERNGAAIVNFFSHQPALNYGYYKVRKSWQQPMDAEGPKETLKEMMKIMKFWLDMGCDGFRVDMAGSLVKNDKEGQGNIKLWQQVRSFLIKEYPEAVMISEWGEPDKSLKGGFHMDFLLHFGPSHYNDLFRCKNPYFSSKGKGNCKKFVRKYVENYEKTNKKGLICIPSGNHDMVRLSKNLGKDQQKLAFAFLLSMPGAPFIYYGDEIGMEYNEELPSKEGAYERTGSRTPMQWDDSKNAGFSEADKSMLYLPVNKSAKKVNVKSSLKDPDSLINEIKKLIKLRKKHEALLNNGNIEFINAAYPLCYERYSREESITVVINPADKEESIKVKKGEIIYSLGKGAMIKDGKCTINGKSAVFIKNES
ncbi:MAG: glycosylase [Lachnospiraceae bacterium]|nr:glycosylase [Lachnospiraceae bacterium]